MSHVLMIDNYDSFTYNVVQALAGLGAEVTVRCNDEIELAEIEAIDPTHIVISPGPGRPENAGISEKVIADQADRRPILGICLGHQAIATTFGGTVSSAQNLMHGKTSEVYHDRKSLFAGLPSPFPAGRYHSLAVSETELPDELSITAFTSDGEIMGLRHKTLAVEGVQFHPESVLTPMGERLLSNFIQIMPARETDHQMAVAL